MCHSEERHFITDEYVRYSNTDVFYVGIGSNVCDEAQRDEEGDSDGLPEAEE